MLVTDGELTIRLMIDAPGDFEVMARWLSDPRVLEFYEGRDRPFDVAAIEEKYAPRVLGEERVTPCIIERRKTPIGYVQYYPLDGETLAEYELNENENPFGFDIFIGEPALWDKGLGTRSVLLTVRYLFDIGAAMVTVDPRVDNKRAVRTYEKAGLKTIKRLPSHEFHEGAWCDNWLMAVSQPR